MNFDQIFSEHHLGTPHYWAIRRVSYSRIPPSKSRGAGYPHKHTLGHNSVFVRVHPNDFEGGGGKRRIRDTTKCCVYVLFRIIAWVCIRNFNFLSQTVQELWSKPVLARGAARRRAPPRDRLKNPKRHIYTIWAYIISKTACDSIKWFMSYAVHSHFPRTKKKRKKNYCSSPLANVKFQYWTSPKSVASLPPVVPSTSTSITGDRWGRNQVETTELNGTHLDFFGQIWPSRSRVMSYNVPTWVPPPQRFWGGYTEYDTFHNA